MVPEAGIVPGGRLTTTAAVVLVFTMITRCVVAPVP
jgi:hypothetical protein